MAATKGAGHLIDHRRQATVGPMAEVEADRVEDVAQQARHGEDADWPAANVHTGPLKAALDLDTQRALRSVAVVAIVK